MRLIRSISLLAFGGIMFLSEVRSGAAQGRTPSLVSRSTVYVSPHGAIATSHPLATASRA
ncbi:MAG: hypothetical protein R2882_10735 [Gemmatimonadales bacterium]